MTVQSSKITMGFLALIAFMTNATTRRGRRYSEINEQLQQFISAINRPNKGRGVTKGLRQKMASTLAGVVPKIVEASKMQNKTLQQTQHELRRKRRGTVHEQRNRNRRDSVQTKVFGADGDISPQDSTMPTVDLEYQYQDYTEPDPVQKSPDAQSDSDTTPVSDTKTFLEGLDARLQKMMRRNDAVYQQAVRDKDYIVKANERQAYIEKRLNKMRLNSSFPNRDKIICRMRSDLLRNHKPNIHHWTLDLLNDPSEGNNHSDKCRCYCGNEPIIRCE